MTELWSRFRRFPLWLQVVIWAALWPVPLCLRATARPPGRRRGPAVLAAASAMVWIAIPLSSSSSAGPTDRLLAGGAKAPVPEVSSTTGPTTAAPPTPTTTRPAGPAGGDPTAVLAGLRVAPEGARTGYQRELFKHWVDADHDGCDTREEVLIAESARPAQVDPYGCKVVAGDWFSSYDGLTFTDPSELDIDHMVPLAEAWDSGASAWDAARRQAYANDLDHPAALRAVSASSNRSKSDLDPGQWKPARDAAWCEYATDWVTVKKAWDLSADQNELDDLRVMLRTCAGSASQPGSGGAVTISALDCQGERVTVHNGGASPADLTGWSIHDDASTPHTYRFPAGFTLTPGAAVTVRSGGPAGPGEFAWTGSNVWNNDGDTATLVNAGGAVTSTKSC